MIIEAGLVLATGYILNSFACFVHTKLKISLSKATSNKRTSVQADNGIRFTYVEPVEDTDDGWDDTPYIRESGTKTVKELKAYAKELGLRGYSKLNKSDLQSFIVEHLQNV